jgi:hypothetical protein
MAKTIKEKVRLKQDIQQQRQRYIKRSKHIFLGDLGGDQVYTPSQHIELPFRSITHSVLKRKEGYIISY